MHSIYKDRVYLFTRGLFTYSFIYLARVSERVCSVRRVETVKLTGNPIARRLWMPQGLPADGNRQAGHADLTHVHDHRRVRTLGRMVSRATGCWMRMGMSLMGVVDVVMRVVQTVRMGAVDVVMRIVEAVMGIVDTLMRIVTR